MAGPFTYPVAQGLPMDNDPALTTAITENLQDFINSICAPDTSQAIYYLGNGEVDYVELFKGSTQTVPNRIARVDAVYDGNLNPTSETWLQYDSSDGTTVLRTVVFTHTWTGVDLTKTTMATT